MTEATSESELERLLAWQLPRCKKSSNDKTATVTAINPTRTAATAPPPTFPTAGTYSIGGNHDTFLHTQSSSIPTAAFEPSVQPEDVLELSELHLADDLLLRSVIQLPGLAKYAGMMCDAVVDNAHLPDLEPSHLCGSRGRDLLASYYHKSIYVADKRDVQAFCTPREIVAATAAAAFLNSAWECKYLVWKNDPDSEHRDTSVQSYVSLDRAVIPAGLDLSQSLLAAEDFGLTPFILYYFTEPDFLKEIAKAIERIGTSREDFAWTHCSPKDNTCKTPFCREYFATHGEFPRSGRTAGPDSTIVKDIVSQIKSDVAKPHGPRPKNSKMLLARQVLKKVWTKLVSINATFAIIGDGQHEMIFMRHRHLQTLFTSPCYDVSRDPYDRILPSQMRVRIGLNIIATLDLVWRANLWRDAGKIGIQVPTNALSKHLTTFVTADYLAQQLLETEKVKAMWVKTPVLLKYVTRREQPPQPDIDRFLDLNNNSHALALDIRHSLGVSMNAQSISPGIYFRGDPYRTELDHPPEAEAHVWGHGDGADEWGWAPLVVQIAVGLFAGKQLETEYQHRLRISATSEAAILPQLYGIFGDSASNAHFLFLEDIGMPLGQYLEYLCNTFSKSRLLSRVRRLDEELRRTLNRLHATGHTHGALLSMSDVLVALDQMGSIRLVFKNLREMQYWPSHREEETKRRGEDIVHMNEIVQDMYTTYGLTP